MNELLIGEPEMWIQGRVEGPGEAPKFEQFEAKR